MNVVFLGRADFDSPPPLGTTDRTRYIKVTTLEEAQRPELHNAPSLVASLASPNRSTADLSLVAPLVT